MTHIEFLEMTEKEYAHNLLESEKDYEKNPCDETLQRCAFWNGAVFGLRYAIYDLKKGGKQND